MEYQKFGTQRDTRLDWKTSFDIVWTNESWHITDNLLVTTFCINYYTTADVNFNEHFTNRHTHTLCNPSHASHCRSCKFDASTTAWHFIGFKTINQVIRYAHKSIEFLCEMKEWRRRLSTLKPNAYLSFKYILSRCETQKLWFHRNVDTSNSSFSSCLLCVCVCGSWLFSPCHAMGKFQSSLLNEAWSCAGARQ